MREGRRKGRKREDKEEEVRERIDTPLLSAMLKPSKEILVQ